MKIYLNKIAYYTDSTVDRRLTGIYSNNRKHVHVCGMYTSVPDFIIPVGTPNSRRTKFRVCFGFILFSFNGLVAFIDARHYYYDQYQNNCQQNVGLDSVT